MGREKFLLPDFILCHMVVIVILAYCSELKACTLLPWCITCLQVVHSITDRDKIDSDLRLAPPSCWFAVY